MKKRDELDQYFSYLNSTVFKKEQTEFQSFFDDAINKGESVLFQKNISETKVFDDEWINTLESYFPSIDKITRNPRSFIKYNEEIVDVERAKKINANSIRHLAAHTQYIRDVNSKNDVTPSKILTIHNETDYDVYENRFIATLINRMFLFVHSRLDVIRQNVESFQKDHFAVDSKFSICTDDVEMRIDLTIKRDLDNKTINEHNYKLLERVEKLSGLIDGLKGSQFMQTMKKSKPVHPPIMKTNVILKNPDFRNAYTLWLFMDRYSTLGYDVSVQEKDLELDKKFKKYIDQLSRINYCTILANQLEREKKYSETEYNEYLKKRKKVLTRKMGELSSEAMDIPLEDNTLNEYFLNKYKKIFKETVEELEETGKVRHDDCLKRALRKTTDIVNGIFESIFRLEEENDIFRKLVDKNVDKEYEEKKNQLKYAKLIRDVKQVDYNKAIRLERRLIKDLQKINTRYIKEKMALKAKELEPTELANLEIEIARFKKENSEYQTTLLELEQFDKLSLTEQESIKVCKEEAINQAKEELKAFEEELKQKTIEKKNLIKKTYKEEQTKYLNNQKQEAKAIDTRRKNLSKIVQTEQNNVLKELQKKKALLEKKYNAKLKKEEELNKKKLNEFISNQKQEQKQKNKENEQLLNNMKQEGLKEQAKIKSEIRKLESELKKEPKKVKVHE